MGRAIPKSQKQNERMVTDWNAKHPVGTKVAVTKDDNSVVETVTKSEAWMLGGHTAVILVEGINGAYALDRCKAL